MTNLSYKLRLLLAFILAPLLLSAANDAPVISNLSITVDTTKNHIEINFDLSDTESDNMEVWFQASNDNGTYWVVDVHNDSLSGDTGFPQTSGTAKQIIWRYNENTIGLTDTNWSDLRIRLIADDHQTINLAEIHSKIDSTRVMNQLYDLEGIRHRTTGLAKLDSTKNNLEDLLDDHDLNPVRQGQMYNGYQCENIVGFASGTREQKKTWLITGHYETVHNSPGGDDNASGVVTVAEAIRVLSEYNTKKSIKYIFFDLEEDGLIGSQHYIGGGIPWWEQMQGVLNMDGIGYYDSTKNSQTLPAGFGTLYPAEEAAINADSNRANFLISIVNTNSVSIDSAFTSVTNIVDPTLKIVSLETPGTGTSTPDFRRSDHARFWDANVPAVFFTDGANYRNPYYHTPNDSVHYLDPGFLMKNIRAIVTTLANQVELEHSSAEISMTPMITGDTTTNDTTIGINPTRTENFLKIFPNPTEGQFNILINTTQATNASVKIFNTNGALMYEMKDSWLTKGKNTISVDADLPNNNYIVEVQGDGFTIRKQLSIVQ